MREVLGRVLGALKFLKPKFNNTGAGAVQIGKAGGSVHVDNTTRHEVTHVHLTQNIVYGVPASSATTSAHPVKFGRHANEAQREVLRMLVSIGSKETGVLDFMEREFKTRKVIDLNDAQLHRTRRYIEAIQRRTPEPAKSGSRINADHELL